VTRKNAFTPFVAGLSPDVICLQETKAQPDQVEVDLPGYQAFWNSAEKLGYSGTAVFTKPIPLSVASGLALEVITAHQVFGDAYGDPNREGRVLTVEFEAFYLVTAYAPNAKPALERLALRHLQWDPALLDHLTRLERTKPVVFCGDLNVAHTPDDLANPKKYAGKKGFTDEERVGFQRYLDAGFVDTFRLFHTGNGHYTWWGNFANARERNLGWRIDYFLVSAALRDKVAAAEIHADVMGSDHCPVSLILDL
jgi:exodeoxyribonuclease-3